MGGEGGGSHKNKVWVLKRAPRRAALLPSAAMPGAMRLSRSRRGAGKGLEATCLFTSLIPACGCGGGWMNGSALGAMEPGPALEVIAWKGHSKARRHRIAAGAGLGAGRGAAERTGAEGIGKKHSRTRELGAHLRRRTGRAAAGRAAARRGDGAPSPAPPGEQRAERLQREQQEENPTNQPGRIADGEGNGTSQPPNEEGRPCPPTPLPSPRTPRFAAARCGSHRPVRAPSGPGAVPLRTAPLRTAPPRRRLRCPDTASGPGSGGAPRSPAPPGSCRTRGWELPPGHRQLPS